MVQKLWLFVTAQCVKESASRFKLVLADDLLLKYVIETTSAWSAASLPMACGARMHFVCVAGSFAAGSLRRQNVG